MLPILRLFAVSFIIFLFSVGIFAQNEVKDSLSRGEKLFQEAEAFEAEKKWEEAIERYDEASMSFLEEEELKKFEECNLNIHSICSILNQKEFIDFYKKKIRFCEENFGEKHIQTGLWYSYFFELNLKFENTTVKEDYFQKSHEIFLNYKKRKLELFNLIYLNGYACLIKKEYKKAELLIKNNLDSFDISTQSDSSSIIKYQTIIANSHLILGKIYHLQADFSKAQYHLEKSALIGLELNLLDLVASTYIVTSYIHLETYNFPKAEEYVQKAFYNASQLYRTDDFQMVKYYYSLGVVHGYFNRCSEAIEFLEKSLNILLANGSEIDYEVAHYYTKLSQLYERNGNLKKALYYSKKSIDAYESTNGNPNSGIFFAYKQLADLYLQVEEKRDSSIIYYNKVLKHLINIHGNRHPNVSALYSSLRNAYHVMGDDEKALFYIQKALTAGSFQFNNLDYIKNPNPTDFIIPLDGLMTLRRKHRTLSQWWIKDKNNPELINQLNTCSDAMYNVLLEQSKNLGGEISTNIDLLDRLNWFAFDNIMRSYDLNKHTKNSIFIDKYFQWMEKIKGQQLLLSFQSSETEIKSKSLGKLLIEEKRFLNRIDSLEQHLFLSLEQKDSVQIKIIQNEALFDLHREREQFLQNLNINHSNYFHLRYDLSPVSLGNLKNKIEFSTLYLELSINYQESPHALYYLVLTNQDENTFKINLDTNYIEKITTFNRLLRSHNLLRADRRRKFIDLSHELYNQFIKPIEHLLEGKERLVIVGEGVTHYLPFEALLKSNEDKPWHELDFLIKDHEISYHYSGTLFARAQEQQQDFDNELLAFAPVFSEGDSSLESLRAGGLLMADTTFRSVEGDNFTPLPHSEKEVKNIEALFPKTATTNILLNETANEQNLKTALEKNHRFVHIASHSFANIDYPKFSGIACAPSDTTQHTDDGILYVGEVYNLAVNSDLVVLSSCESGVGKLLGGEGMLGLNRSFVYAGVPNVIFSLWKVYDENTGELMTEFYKNTLEGQSYSKALRTAKLKMLANPETAAPDIWAAFLLVGR